MTLLNFFNDYNTRARRRRLALENEMDIEKAKALLQMQSDFQRAAQLASPSIPLEAPDLTAAIAEASRQGGQPLSQEQLGGLAQSAARPDQRGVGMRRPFTEGGSLLSYAPTDAPMTNEQFGQRLATAREQPPITAETGRRAVQRSLMDWANLDAPSADVASRDPMIFRSGVQSRTKVPGADRSQTITELAREWAFETDPAKKARLKAALDEAKRAESSTPDTDALDKLYNATVKTEAGIAARKIAKAFGGFSVEYTPDGGFKMGADASPEAQKAFFDELDTRMRKRIAINPRLAPYTDMHAKQPEAAPVKRPGWFSNPNQLPDIGTPETPAAEPTAPTTGARVPIEQFSPDAQAAIAAIMASTLPPEEKDRRIKEIDDTEMARIRGQ